MNCFHVNGQKWRHLKTFHTPLYFLLIRIAYKLLLGTILTASDEEFFLEKGVNNTVLLEQCERLSYS